MGKVTSNKNNVQILDGCHIAFQMQGGIGSNQVIKTLNTAVYTDNSNMVQVRINPINGVYTLPIQRGGVGMFEVNNFRFMIKRVNKINIVEKDEHLNFPTITFWDELETLDTEQLSGIQQRLKILGYYHGVVDNQFGSKTEEAILHFQTDIQDTWIKTQGTRDYQNNVIDGKPSTLLVNNLNNFFWSALESGTKTLKTNNYIHRVVFFTIKRAVTGPSQKEAPHPDTRGMDTLPIVPCSSNSQIKTAKVMISFTDSRILKSYKGGLLTLYPCYKKRNYLTINKIEMQDPDMTFTFDAKATDVIQLHFNSINGPLVYAFIVSSYPYTIVNVRVNLLKVKGTASKNWSIENIKKHFEHVNAIWFPAGIHFNIAEVKYIDFHSHSIVDTHHYYSLTSKSSYQSDLDSTLLMTKPKRGSMINSFFVDSYLQNLEYYRQKTITKSPAGFSSVNGVLIRTNNTEDETVPSAIIAHELGHQLNLANLIKNADGQTFIHSDVKLNSGEVAAFRKDTWSLSRLMAASLNYSHKYIGWALDTDYSIHPKSVSGGSWITVKPIYSDNTDGEIMRARYIAHRPSMLYR